ncbi:MAG: PaaI family thioesterase [Acidimicrobiales bacterium]
MSRVPTAPTSTAAELTERLHRSFPETGMQARITVDEVGDKRLRLRYRVSAEGAEIRPGGTVSGPTLMTMADTVAWLLTLAQLPAGVDALTSSLTISFLRPPAPSDLVGEGRLLRMGRRLSVVDVTITSVGQPDPVAVATVTYAPLLG